jgi:hypothetical protein
MLQIRFFVMIQQVLMPPVVDILLKLLRMVAVDRIAVQVLRDIAQIFVRRAFHLRHLPPPAFLSDRHRLAQDYTK